MRDGWAQARLNKATERWRAAIWPDRRSVMAGPVPNNTKRQCFLSSKLIRDALHRASSDPECLGEL
jgi:hypothetical protein